jgi:hypothetical protein
MFNFNRNKNQDLKENDEVVFKSEVGRVIAAGMRTVMVEFAGQRIEHLKADQLQRLQIAKVV